MKSAAALILLTFALFYAAPAHAATFDWATVGNPGNADDIHGDGYGGVDYTYRISKHEVTNAQYAEFLNAVASTDSFGGGDPTLYSPSMGSSTWGGITRSGSAGSYTYAVKSPAVGQGPGSSAYTYNNKPVVYVSFFDAMRFVNWLHNGQGSGGTETGVYNISGGLSETRSASAKYWIPSEDEWYKAAYYDPSAGGGSGGYYDYPMSSDNVPNNHLPTADTGNSGNFYHGDYTTGNSLYPFTDVGAYARSTSPYGTFDQGGNVLEWIEEVNPLTLKRLLRGGPGDYVFELHAAESGGAYPPTGEDSTIGFRVASTIIPEPSTMLLGALAAGGLLMRRRR
jgi:formylglycine-generating enzyme required for sulfatase activity